MCNNVLACTFWLGYLRTAAQPLRLENCLATPIVFPIHVMQSHAHGMHVFECVLYSSLGAHVEMQHAFSSSVAVRGRKLVAHC